MVLTYAKDITRAYGGNVVRDCVITVPAFATQLEREALVAAAELADLRVLSLVEANTAAALQFGLDRKYDEPRRVLIYNVGSESVQASVVEYERRRPNISRRGEVRSGRRSRRRTAGGTRVPTSETPAGGAPRSKRRRSEPANVPVISGTPAGTRRSSRRRARGRTRPWASSRCWARAGARARAASTSTSRSRSSSRTASTRSGRRRRRARPATSARFRGPWPRSAPRPRRPRRCSRPTRRSPSAARAAIDARARRSWLRSFGRTPPGGGPAGTTPPGSPTQTYRRRSRAGPTFWAPAERGPSAESTPPGSPTPPDV